MPQLKKSPSFKSKIGSENLLDLCFFLLDLMSGIIFKTCRCFFLPLPEAKQKKILDFAEFLFLKYSKEAIGENQGISNQPSEELLALLSERLKQYEENKLAVSWNETKKEILNRYN